MVKKIGMLISAIFLIGCVHHGQIAPSISTQCASLRHQYMMLSGLQQGAGNQVSQKQNELKKEYGKLQCAQETTQPL